MLGWLTRLVVLFAVLGVLAYDGVTLVVANVGAADDATRAASAAAEAYRSSKDIQTAYNAAAGELTNPTEEVEATTFSVAPDGVVSLVVIRKPPTLWMQHVPPLRGMTTVRQSGSGRPHL